MIPVIAGALHTAQLAVPKIAPAAIAALKDAAILTSVAAGAGAVGGTAHAVFLRARTKSGKTTRPDRMLRRAERLERRADFLKKSAEVYRQEATKGFRQAAKRAQRATTRPEKVARTWRETVKVYAHRTGRVLRHLGMLAWTGIKTARWIIAWSALTAAVGVFSETAALIMTLALLVFYCVYWLTSRGRRPAQASEAEQEAVWGLAYPEFDVQDVSDFMTEPTTKTVESNVVVNTPDELVIELVASTEDLHSRPGVIGRQIALQYADHPNQVVRDALDKALDDANVDGPTKIKVVQGLLAGQRVHDQNHK